jgi:type 1 glutamine amidotransferase
METTEMKNPHSTLSRRGALAAGLSSFVAAIPARSVQAVPKAPGETKVIYFGGDYVHNGVAQELGIRETFSATGWRIFFAQASRFITPAELADTDLLIMTRTGVTDVLGFSTLGLIEKRPAPDPFLPPETEEALIDNIRTRGMGFLALHCTAGNPALPRLMELLGVRPFKSGAPLQPVAFSGFNPNHPISRGFSDFAIDLDENLKKEIVDPAATVLFTATGLNDKTSNPGGWCIERGKGRIAVLLAGHSDSVWKHSSYRQLHWRAAWWALGREIPEFRMAK